MKTSRFPLILFHSALAFAPVPPLAAQDLFSDNPPKPGFQRNMDGTNLLTWQGEDHVVSFVRYSIDLKNWHIAPTMTFGTGEQSFAMWTDVPRMFFRIQHELHEEIDTLEEAMLADFDGDGIVNITEVEALTDPKNAASTEGVADAKNDGDEDGMSLFLEQANGKNPHRKDHPAITLQVEEA